MHHGRSAVLAFIIYFFAPTQFLKQAFLSPSRTLAVALSPFFKELLPFPTPPSSSSLRNQVARHNYVLLFIEVAELSRRIQR
jgi:hypothetical protein